MFAGRMGSTLRPEAKGTYSENDKSLGAKMGSGEPWPREAGTLHRVEAWGGCAPSGRGAGRLGQDAASVDISGDDEQARGRCPMNSFPLRRQERNARSLNSIAQISE